MNRITRATRAFAPVVLSVSAFTYCLSAKSLKLDAVQQEPVRRKADLMAVPVRGVTRADVQNSREAALLSPTVISITVVGGAAIVTLLLLALRSAHRTERTQDFIKAVERLIANDASVRTAVGGGGVYAAGSYKLAIDNLLASGRISLSAPGKLAGRIEVEAARENKRKPWEFTSAVVYIDKQLLAERNEGRAKFAEESGYGPAALAIRNAIDAASQYSHVSSVRDDSGHEVLKFVLK